MSKTMKSLYIVQEGFQEYSFLFMNPVSDKQTSAQETLSTTLKS